MKRKPAAKPKRTRSTRRTPDARALEWAEKRLERAEKLHQWHTEKLQGLNAEIPRLRGIIAVLGPAAPTVTKAAVKGVATFDSWGTPRTLTNKDIPDPLAGLQPKIVAGMDVSRFVNPRPTVAVPEPILSDSEDALIDAVDGILPKGTPLGE